MTKASLILEQLARNSRAELADAHCSHPEIYWNEEIAATEEKTIFRRDWVCPGLAAEIPELGDYMTYSVAGEPVFTIRGKNNKIKTYSNICRHRMMALLEGTGNTSRIVCPYHAWTYSLSGQLIAAPHMERSTGFEKRKIQLKEIKTEIWNGWIYITLNREAPSMKESLVPLEEIVSPYGMENYVPVLKEENIWKTNWKLLTENFMEGYHLPVAHKKTVGAWFKLEDTKFPQKTYDTFTFQTFVKTGKATYGKAHRDNNRLSGKWRNTSILPTIFPSHMYVLAPDHLWYLTLRPLGVGEVDVRFGVAIAPEVDAVLKNKKERAEWISNLTAFFDHVNTEDRKVVESIFEGSKTSSNVSGQLSWLERELHDFQKYLASRLI